VKKTIGGKRRTAALDVLVECQCGHRFIKGSFEGWFCPSCGSIATVWAHAQCALCGTRDPQKIRYARMSDRNVECTACVQKEQKARD